MFAVPAQPPCMSLCENVIVDVANDTSTPPPNVLPHTMQFLKTGDAEITRMMLVPVLAAKVQLVKVGEPATMRTAPPSVVARFPTKTHWTSTGDEFSMCIAPPPLPAPVATFPSNRQLIKVEFAPLSR